MHHGVFEPHLGWIGGIVACYRGEVTCTDGERIFVALFGSASNVIGRRATAGADGGYYPSDIHGLYTILDAARERYDPEIDLEYRWDDAAMEASVRADTAMRFARNGARINVGLNDLLARVFLCAEEQRFDDGSSGRVIVGTPLWVATPRPRQWSSGAV